MVTRLGVPYVFPLRLRLLSFAGNLTTASASRTSTKSDDDFHELLMSTLPNKYLRSAYDRITGLNTRFRIMTGKVSMINQDQTCEEHLLILGLRP